VNRTTLALFFLAAFPATAIACFLAWVASLLEDPRAPAAAANGEPMQPAFDQRIAWFLIGLLSAFGVGLAVLGVLP
jgi:hypothetical protein